ncbi:MAG: hypothetical protein R3C11_20610 [Planctomycetaceae bacterium]
MWNLNFPHETPAGPRGLKIVSMGCDRQADSAGKERIDLRGKPYYWCGLEPIKGHSKDPVPILKQYRKITPLIDPSQIRFN